MGIDLSKVYTTQDLASGDDLIFVATGITDGELFKGVHFFGGGGRTHSLVMTYRTGTIRFVDTVHIVERRSWASFDCKSKLQANGRLGGSRG